MAVLWTVPNRLSLSPILIAVGRVPARIDPSICAAKIVLIFSITSSDHPLGPGDVYDARPLMRLSGMARRFLPVTERDTNFDIEELFVLHTDFKAFPAKMVYLPRLATMIGVYLRG
jgi:hypothetical protein